MECSGFNLSVALEFSFVALLKMAYIIPDDMSEGSSQSYQPTFANLCGHF